MLANASISQADVSKAKPQRGPAGHWGTRTPAGGRTGGPTGGGVSGGGGAAYRLQESSSAVEEEGRGHRVGEMRVGEGGRQRVGEEPLVGDGRNAQRGETAVTTTEEERRGGDLGENG
jgi:hypothetical protein